MSQIISIPVGVDVKLLVTLKDAQGNAINASQVSELRCVIYNNKRMVEKSDINIVNSTQVQVLLRSGQELTAGDQEVISIAMRYKANNMVNSTSVTPIIHRGWVGESPATPLMRTVNKEMIAEFTIIVPPSVYYAGASPKIGPNGNFFVFNDTTKEYEDTGFLAAGSEQSIRDAEANRVIEENKRKEAETNREIRLKEVEDKNAQLETNCAYLFCNTAREETDKIVNNDNFRLTKNARLSIKMTFGNTAITPRLNINNTGAIDVDINAKNSIIPEGSYIDVFYNGEKYIANLLYDVDYGLSKKDNLITSKSVLDTTYVDIPVVLLHNGYVSSTGAVELDPLYKRTDYISVTSGAMIYIWSAGVGFYDANKKPISPIRSTPAYDLFINIPEGVSYIILYALESQISSVYLNVNAGVSAFLDKKIIKNHSDYISYNKRNISLDVDNAISMDYYGVTLSDGKYNIPIEFDDKYSLSFEFKMPRDINSCSEDVNILDIPSYAGTANYGGVIVQLSKAVATFGESQQVNYKSKITASPNKQGLTNNYGCVHQPTGYPFKAFAGDDCFSIRFIGDVNNTNNQHIKYSISDSGISIIRSDIEVIASVGFPSDKNYIDFCKSMVLITSEGGALHGVIEFKVFKSDITSTDDIVRVSNIPMLCKYNFGWDAYPCYVQTIDYSWHKLEVRYNASGTNGRERIIVLLDGYPLNWVDSSFPHEKRGYKGSIYVGNNSIEVRNFEFSKDTFVVKSPKIMLYVAHGLLNGLDGDGDYSSNGLSMTLGRMQKLIDLNNKYGFTYVPMEKVRDYVVRGIELPNRCWSITHDDYYYFDDNTPDTPSYNFRQLYKKNNMLVDCSMIMDEATEMIKSNAGRDYKIFGLHLHGSIDCSNSKYATLVSTLLTDYNNFRKSFGDTDMYTYPYGNTNINVVHVMKELGFSACYTTHTLNPLFASKRHCEQSLPRSYTVPLSEINIDAIWLENNIIYASSM